jgi:hypothetical protein
MKLPMRPAMSFLDEIRKHRRIDDGMLVARSASIVPYSNGN